MLLAGVLILFGFGQALGARGHAQRAADLAAVSAAQVMRRNLTRLYEPAVVEGRAESATSVERGVSVARPEPRRCAAPRQRRGAAGVQVRFARAASRPRA